MGQNKIRIKGKEYPVEIKDGIPHINDMPVKEFLNTLEPDDLLDLSFNGGEAIVEVPEEMENFDLSSIRHGKEN